MVYHPEKLYTNSKPFKASNVEDFKEALGEDIYLINVFFRDKEIAKYISNGDWNDVLLIAGNYWDVGEFKDTFPLLVVHFLHLLNIDAVKDMDINSDDAKYLFDFYLNNN